MLILQKTEINGLKVQFRLMKMHFSNLPKASYFRPIYTARHCYSHGSDFVIAGYLHKIMHSRGNYRDFSVVESILKNCTHIYTIFPLYSDKLHLVDVPLLKLPNAQQNFACSYRRRMIIFNLSS